MEYPIPVRQTCFVAQYYPQNTHMSVPTPSSGGVTEEEAEEGPGRGTHTWDKWCFTAFRTAAGPVTAESRLDFSACHNVVESIYQVETCPESKRIHLQGAIKFKTRVGLSTVKSLPCGFVNPSVRGCKGTWAHNLAYCSKPGASAGPFRHAPRPSFVIPDCRREYWYSPTGGNGKGTEARNLAFDLGYRVWEHPGKADASKGTWLAGYDGEECVIMDEVKEDWYSPSNWKKILDTMPQRMASGSGGASVIWAPKLIIMIANEPPWNLFSTQPFQRRITRVRKINRDAFPFTPTILEGGAEYAPPKRPRLQ